MTAPRDLATPPIPPILAGADPAGEAIHHIILHQLDEDQAIDIISIPLAGISAIADHMVIASGRSSRHVAAMAEKIAQRLKQDAGVLSRLEGLPTADWVLLDAGDVIVHLFRPEVRSFYNLERMWGADLPTSASTVVPAAPAVAY